MAGVTIFCADLATRYLWGASPLPLLAPVGGVTMIAGWLLVIVCGLFARRG